METVSIPQLQRIVPGTPPGDGVEGTPAWELTTEAHVEFNRLADKTLQAILDIMSQHSHPSSSAALPLPPQTETWRHIVGRLLRTATSCVPIHRRPSDDSSAAAAAGGHGAHEMCRLDVEMPRVAAIAFRAGTLVRKRAAAWAEKCFRKLKPGLLTPTQTHELELHFERYVDAMVESAQCQFPRYYENYCQLSKNTQ